MIMKENLLFSDEYVSPSLSAYDFVRESGFATSLESPEYDGEL